MSDKDIWHKIHVPGDADGDYTKKYPHLSDLLWLNSVPTLEYLTTFGKNKTIYTEEYIPRGQDFTKKYELIFSGCSETNGDYLSHDEITRDNGKNIWGTKVANYLGLDFLNMGRGGSSVWQIVSSLLSQFERGGDPKIVLCLLPNLTRLIMPNDPKNLVSKYGKNLYLIEDIDYQPDKNRPNFSKKPHKKEEIIPSIIPVWMNLQALLFLEQYCRSNKITLMYSTWSEQTAAILSSIISSEQEASLSVSYPNYIDTDPRGWAKEEYFNLFCHKNIEKKFPDLFKYGTDGEHMGIHRHQHIADIFIQNLTKS